MLPPARGPLLVLLMPLSEDSLVFFKARAQRNHVAYTPLSPCERVAKGQELTV
jgi:hypothetical protein